jgi:hypothetical protein
MTIGGQVQTEILNIPAAITDEKKGTAIRFLATPMIGLASSSRSP